MGTSGNPVTRLFATFGIVAFIVAILFLLLQSIMPEKTDGMIDSVQPRGYIWTAWIDSFTAKEINKPNSEANHNNGEAAESFAQATKTVEEANAIKAQTAEERHKDTAVGAMFGILCVLSMFAGIIVLITMPFLFARTH